MERTRTVRESSLHELALERHSKMYVAGEIIGALLLWELGWTRTRWSPY